MVTFIAKLLGVKMENQSEECEKQSLKLTFRGSGTKIISSTLNVTHEMPNVIVEAESIEKGYEIARFKYHDIGYDIVHALQCIDGTKINKKP